MMVKFYIIMKVLNNIITNEMSNIIVSMANNIIIYKYSVNFNLINILFVLFYLHERKFISTKFKTICY